MNKTLLSLLTFTLFVSSSLFADSKVEARADAFFSTSKRYRDVYGNVNSSYQLEVSISNDNIVDTFINFDWLSKQGRHSGCNTNTKIQVSNLTGGVKFRYPYYELLVPYIGAGFNAGSVSLKNHSCYKNSRKTKIAFGYTLKSGVYIPLEDPYFIDLFIDYLSLNANFKKGITRLNGFKMGIGVGLTW